MNNRASLLPGARRQGRLGAVGWIGMLGLLLWAGSTHARVTLTGSGRSYPVIESSSHKALINKIRAEAQQAPHPSQVKVVLKRHPKPAREERIRKVATTYLQPHDLVSHQGQVIIAKGTRIEPLRFIQLPVIIAVEADSIQLKWAKAKQAELEKAGPAFILIANGSAWDVAQRYGLRVYHLDDRYMERFQIQRVPCVIRQIGLNLEIHEYAL